MTDLKIQYESLKQEIDAAMREVIDETCFIQGRHVEALEKDVCSYFESNFAVGVASGTDALVLSLTALGIGKGDEVITTPFTFIATAEAVSRTGAKPVFCDIDYDTFNIDAKLITGKITKKTKAILPVHLYGLPCDMKRIVTVAKEHGLKLIEDCAQSFGAKYDGKATGTFGECGCLSFFPAKTLGCYGDGGMVITGSDETARRLKMLRNHGSTSKYVYGSHGFNSRLDTIQAAILRIKIKYVSQWLEKRQKNGLYYNSLLAGTPGIAIPTIPQEAAHGFNYYTIRIGKDRDGVQARLKEKSIPSMVYYPLGLHLQESYKELGHTKGDFPVTETAQEQVLSLPMYPELTYETIKHIADTLKDIL